MNQSLRQTTLEAERLAIEFSRACATGNDDNILGAAMHLSRAADVVVETIRQARYLSRLASYDHPPAEGFSEGVGQQ